MNSAGEFFHERKLAQRPYPRCPVQGLAPQGRAPTTVKGIEKYLGSGMIRGIGPISPNVEGTFHETAFDISIEEPIAIKRGPRNVRIASHRYS
jgi:hypothetical protein